MMVLEVFYSFRSPYSYLAVDRLNAIENDYALDLRFRPVRPLAMREPDFFEKGRKQFLPYLVRDVAREAERLGVAIAAPDPDPIQMNMETGKVAPEQPDMMRVMSLAFAAIEHKKGLAFAQSAGRRIWSGQPWTSDEALSGACVDAGLELSALSSWSRENQKLISERIAENEAAQLEYHWGVPLMVLDGEPFFGQDRLDSLVWRLEKMGVKHR
ncbi:DsbA family protein [Hyphococcus flavus]|uniref:2-hydroxychromene-2-carboxylate isomerase n=1 Tax=Hyphococcus flavus TaxID=1866326 RepID=A0AAF0CFG6_9PROT|nr:DsbA family protein [Hyphococcus flavus]WDI32456.1 DsbA family protein [Hyphococcus flavus]